MRVRRLAFLRLALFLAGLSAFAAVGLFAHGWAALSRAPLRSRGRGLARWLAAAGLRFVEAVYPGVVAVSPFGGQYCRVGRVSYPPRVRPLEVFPVEVVLENIGAEAWQGRGGSHPVRLGTWDPPDRPSAFHHPETWPQENRAGELAGDLSPLGAATFRMMFRAPAAPGVYGEVFAPVAERLRWFPAQPIRITVEVVGYVAGTSLT